MKNILITGAAGAIGYHLAEFLSKKENQLFLVDNFCRSEKDQAYLNLIAKPNVIAFELDLCDKEALQQLPKEMDYIYHMAAMNGTQNFYEKPFDVIKHCTLPTINLLDHYANSLRMQRFIYAGSSEAYAASISKFSWPVPTDETVPLGIEDPLNVRWSYGGSKLHGELAVVAAAKQFKTPFNIIRFHNVYGPRMGDKHVIPDFLARAKKGIYELYGYEDTRSFIYISDAINAVTAIAESAATINEIINVGGTPEVTMLQLAQKIMAILDIDASIKCYPSPKGSVKRRAPDLGKLFKLTDFKPETSLEHGLTKTIQYYLQIGF